MSRKINISKEILVKEYTQNEKSTIKIAKQFNCNKTTIIQKMIKFNIYRRSSSEAQKIVWQKKHKPNCKCASCKSKIDSRPNHQKGCQCSFCKATRGEYKGRSNPNYINGKGNFPYPLKFNETLKEQIRKRDNYKCQLCGIIEEIYLIIVGKNLTVHHTDYNKQNCKEDNLITLCKQCNSRVNFNRNYWYAYFKYIINEKLN